MRKSRPRSKSNHVSERSSESSGKSRQLRRAESKGSGKQKDGTKTEETSDEDEAINYPNNPPIQNGFVVFIHQVNFSSSSKEKRRVVEWISDALKMMNITPEVVTVDNLMEQSITVCSKPKSPVIKFARPVVENDTGTAKSDNSGPSSKSGGKYSHNKAMSPSRRKVSTAKSRPFSNPAPSSAARSKSPREELTREKSIHSSSSKALERKSGRPMKPQAIEDKKQEYGVQMSVLKDKVRKMQKENNNSVWVLLVESRKRCIVDMGQLNSLATRCRFKVRWIAAQAPRSLDQSVFSVVNDVVQTKNLCFPEQMRAIRRRTDSKSRTEKPKKAKNKPVKSNTIPVEVLHKALSKQFNVSSFASFDPNQFMDGGVMAEDELAAREFDEGEADSHSYNNKEKIESSLESELRRLENGIVSEGSEKDPAVRKHREDKPQPEVKSHHDDGSPRKTEQQTNLNTETTKDLNISGASHEEEHLSKEMTKDEGSQQDAVEKSTKKYDSRKGADGQHKRRSVDSSNSTSNGSSSDEFNEKQMTSKNLVLKVDATVGLALVDNNHPPPRVTTMLPGLSCSSTCRTYTKKSSIIRRSWDFNGNNNSNDINDQAVVVFTRNVNGSRTGLARILESLLEVNGISSYTLKVTELLTQPVGSTRKSGKVSRSNSSQDLSAGCKRLIEKGVSARLKEKSSHVVIVDVEDESYVNMWPIFNSSTKLGHKCLVLESSPDGTFEDNLEKVLRTIRLRLGQEQLDGVEALPEMPSFERTISSSSNASQSQKTPTLHQLEVHDDCKENVKSQQDNNNYSDIIWTVQSVQRIVSASKTPSGVASFTNADNRVSDSNIYQSPLVDTPPVEEGFDHSFSRVPSIYNVDDPSPAPNMSASVEDSTVFRTKTESDTQSYGANSSNDKEPPENPIKTSSETASKSCQSVDPPEHNTERRHLGPEEPTAETENGNILVRSTLSVKPLSSRTVTGKNVQKGRRKDRSSSSSVRMRRRSAAKTRSRDGITIDSCKDCNSNHSTVVSKPGTGTSEAESTSSDEEHNVKPRKTSSNLREPVRVTGVAVARRSKERLCEGSLLQIHRCETTKLGAGGTGSSMPEDDLFCGWVARARTEVKTEKKGLFIRTQSRLAGFFQRFCTCSKRRVGRAPRKLTVQDIHTTEPSPNVARMHSFH